MKEILRRFFDNLGDIAHVDCFSCLFAPKAALSVTLRYSGGDYHLYGQADPSVPVMPTGGSWFFGKGLNPKSRMPINLLQKTDNYHTLHTIKSSGGSNHVV
jgi:hypothetical protein